MKIALVKPPDFGQSKRGIDFYAEGLLGELVGINGLTIEMISFDFWQRNCGLFDLVHYPYFTPFFLTLPFIKKKKMVVTVHDLIPLVFPEGFPKGVRGEAKWLMQKSLLRYCDGIICDSLASKNDVVGIIGCPPEKVTVTYLGIEPDYRKIKNDREFKVVRGKYNLSENFFLYVGDINYHKNIESLIRAFSVCRSQFSKDVKLILVGGAFAKENLPEAKEIKKLVTNLSLETAVIFTGFVPTSDLVAIYNLAMAYIHPAFYEGFGLTVLQAFACGCPVVSGRGGSLREITADAAIIADVRNVDSLARRMLEIAGLNGKERNALIQKGFVQARKFSWEKTAQETYAVYQKVLGRV